MSIKKIRSKPPEKRSRLKRTLGCLEKIVASFGALVLSGAMYSGYVFYNRSMKSMQEGSLRILSECPKEYVPFCWQPNFDATFNSLGYKEKELGEKGEEGYRLICLGGSTTFQPREDNNKDRCDYPSLLEWLLTRGIPPEWQEITNLEESSELSDKKHNIQVYNFGIEAYSVYEIADLVENEIDAWHADAIIVSEPFNFYNAGKIGGYENPQGKSRKLTEPKKKLLVAGALFNMLVPGLKIAAYSLLPGIDPSSYGYATRFSGYDYASEIGQVDKIRSICEKKGVKLILGMHPDSMQKPFEGEILSTDDIKVPIKCLKASKHAAETFTLKRGFTREIKEYALSHKIPLIDWESRFDRLLFYDNMALYYLDKGNVKIMYGRPNDNKFSSNHGFLVYYGDQVFAGRNYNDGSINYRLFTKNGTLDVQLPNGTQKKSDDATKGRLFDEDYMHFNCDGSKLMALIASQSIKGVLESD